MTDAWAGGLLALGGVALQAIIQARLAGANFRREKAWTYRENRRGQLEQTYEAAYAVVDAYRWHYLDARSILAHSTGGSGKRAVPLPRLQMLVALYVPEVRELLFKLEKAGEELISATVVLVLHPEPDGVGMLDAAYDAVELRFNMLIGALNGESDRLKSAERKALGEPSDRPGSS